MASQAKQHVGDQTSEFFYEAQQWHHTSHTRRHGTAPAMPGETENRSRECPISVNTPHARRHSATPTSPEETENPSRGSAVTVNPQGNSLGEVMRPHGIAVETAYDTSHPITVVEIDAECTKEM